MANFLAIAGAGAALLAGLAAHAVREPQADALPGWINLPSAAQVSINAASAQSGRLDLRFEGPSDELLNQMALSLRENGFAISSTSGEAGAVGHGITARQPQSGRMVSIDVTELPDHDIWHVAYADGGAG